MIGTQATQDSTQTGKTVKPPAWVVHAWILPRWFALPVAVGPVLLGYFFMGLEWQGSRLSLLAALIAASCLMASLHCWNSVVDYWSGVDKPGGSVEKPYTSGSQVLPQKWAPLWAVVLNALVWLSIAFAACFYLVDRTGSNWPWFGFGMGFLFGAFYAPIWKYVGVPEACGILAFGVGGVAIGMSVAGTVPIKESFLLGLAVSVPFAVSWGVDQAYDSASDIHRGVQNIGGLLRKTGFPASLYTALGALFSYVPIYYLVSAGILNQWAGLVMFTAPFWVLCVAWLWASEKTMIGSKPQAKALDRGVRWGLIAIFLHTALLVVAVAAG